MLGAPGTEVVDSRGAAAGATFEQAAERAVLEWLEHHHIEHSADSQFEYIRSDDFPSLKNIREFLDRQLRTLSLHVLKATGYVVTRVVSSDRNGGRPVVGTAAGIDLPETVVRATWEALLLWRNMIEMERTGQIPDDSRESTIFRTYRGAEPLSSLAAHEANGPSCSPAVPRPLMEIAAALCGKRVRLIDLTSPDIGVPVARIIVG